MLSKIQTQNTFQSHSSKGKLKRKLNMLLDTDTSSFEDSITKKQFLVQEIRSNYIKCRGRPAKPSKKLQLLEKQIREASWDMSLLEECLYLKYLGAIAKHDERTLQIALNIINSNFNKECSEQFKEMHAHSKVIFSQGLDPLGEEYTLLSEQYFLKRLLIKRSDSNKMLPFTEFLTIFAYQIYNKTNIEGFTEIMEMLKQVYSKCRITENKQVQNEIGINSSLNPDIIFQIAELNKDQQHIYSLLYKIMKNVFTEFNTSRTLLYLIKN